MALNPKSDVAHIFGLWSDKTLYVEALVWISSRVDDPKNPFLVDFSAPRAAMVPYVKRAADMFG